MLAIASSLSLTTESYFPSSVDALSALDSKDKYSASGTSINLDSLTTKDAGSSEAWLAPLADLLARRPILPFLPSGSHKR